MLQLAWLMLALPAAGALVNLLLGHRMGKQTIGAIGAGVVGLAFVVALGLFLTLLGMDERVHTQVLWNWITIGEFEARAALLIDPLSVTMALIVTGVGALIHVYSISYMERDERFQRFFVYLNFFIFAMLILVLSDNFVAMFVGWEGVGLASYLLIGFWFDRRDDSYGYYADAGKKAFLVNRIGDFGMIVAMLALWMAVGSLTFLEVFEQVEGRALTVGAANLICLLLLLAATGKSAQIPLYVWLPDAMAGPTPVSALIHAATMVTAGIYLIVRTHPLWQEAATASGIAAWIGGLTALFAATIALTQVDLKKIFAYSTISQLGFMMMAAGAGAYGAAIFHLTTHAFFKALLFLAAGSVMHATGGELDIRKMGGLQHKMPATYRAFVVGAAALAGIPLLSGFFSKDATLLGALAYNPVLYAVGAVAALLTALYSFRAVFLTFHGAPRDRHLYDHAHESHALMTTPLWILAALSIFGGLLNLPFVLTMEQWLAPAIGEHEAPSLTLELATITLSVIIALFGFVMARARYLSNEPWPRDWAAQFSGLEPLINAKWYVDELYMAVIVTPLRRAAEWFAGAFDQRIIDGTVNWVGTTSMELGERVRRLQNGAIPTYALTILVGVVALVAYFVFGG